jgi:hypothetical protein
MQYARNIVGYHEAMAVWEDKQKELPVAIRGRFCLMAYLTPDELKRHYNGEPMESIDPYINTRKCIICLRQWVQTMVSMFQAQKAGEDELGDVTHVNDRLYITRIYNEFGGPNAYKQSLAITSDELVRGVARFSPGDLKFVVDPTAGIMIDQRGMRADYNPALDLPYFQ